MHDNTAAPPAPTPSLSNLLSAQAQEHGNQTFLRTPAGTLSYTTADRRVDQMASGLQCLGIGVGDRVALLMHNSAAQVLLWLALDRIGAVNVPVNTGLAGALLERAINSVDPSLLVVDARLMSTLGEALGSDALADLPIFVHGPNASHQRCTDLPTAGDLHDLTCDTPPVRPDIGELSPAVMLFTSGSTGVPKACVLSRRHIVRAGQIHAKYLKLTSDDVLFTPFPLFHIDAATLTVGAAIATGGTAALVEKFSATNFWRQIRESGATVFNFMGATANILWKQPASDLDRDHRVRLAWGVPMPSCGAQWHERFGFPLVEVYGLTDAGVPAYQRLDSPRVPGSCGRVITEYDVKIGTHDGDPLPPGTIGEILIRGNEPGLLMTEYFGMPDATSEAFRDGWFRTGDLAHLDEHGNLFFHSRRKEVIRRRGENIAATDVESGVDAHPDVRESAAVGVPSELSDDDVRAFVVLQPGSRLEPADIVAHCRQTMPRHMVPRYIDIVTALPKTATEKIERAKLAERPLTEWTWDSEMTGPSACPPRMDVPQV